MCCLIENYVSCFNNYLIRVKVLLVKKKKGEVYFKNCNLVILIFVFLEILLCMCLMCLV